MTDALAQYYEKSFISAGEDGSIYLPMTVLEKAGHDRKGKLLDKLNLPSLSDLTVVDYGVGNWGFGCVYPKLKECKVAIGVDISQFAIDCSRKLSEKDPMLSGKNTKFITSSGYDIKIDNQVADIVFAGECIEHIEDTEAFLGEIWRILKPNGIAIFTTPNEKPYIYKQQNLKWAMGFEHVALMDSIALLNKLEKFFIIETTKGYNSSFNPEIDSLIKDENFAKEWALTCENNFHNATGLIVQVRKKPSEETLEMPQKYFHKIVESDSAICFPEYRDLSLYEETLGRCPMGDSAYLSIPVPDGALRCQVILWSHPWSGIATVETKSFHKEIDLYSHVSGCIRISLDAKDLSNCNEIRVTPTGKKRALSNGNEVIFFRAVFSLKTYTENSN